MKNFFKITTGVLVGFSMLVPLVSSAQENPVNYSNSTPPGNYSNNTPPGNNSDTSCGFAGNTFKLCNPLDVYNFCDLIKAILNAVLVLGIPVATLFLVWAGFMFIVARGSPDKLKVARQNLMYVVIGIAIFIGAWTIVTAVIGTVQQLGGGTLKICGKTSSTASF